MAIVQDVLDRAREVLNDPAKVRWTDPALMFWLNDAMDMLRAALPQLFILRGVHTATLGALQTLALAKAREIVDVIGVTPCDKRALDSFIPTWQAGATGVAINWMPSTASPKSFLVYPPSTVGQSITVEYAVTPTELSALSDTLPVTDDYVSPLADYVIGMAETKDAEHVNSGRAQVFMQSFASKLGIKPAA